MNNRCNNDSCSCEKKPFYITTAIAYSSRKPHIGNVYEAIFTTPLQDINVCRDMTFSF